MRLRVTGIGLARVLALVVIGLAAGACDISVDGDGGFSLGVGPGRASDEWVRSYDLSAGGELTLINVNGRIDAEAADGPAVEVRAARVARASTDEAAQEILDSLEMREEVSDDQVRVEVRAPRRSGFGGHELTWTIKVPKGVNVDLRTVNGGVRLTGLDGTIRARSTNGAVRGSDLAPKSLDASVTNGGVDMSLVSADAAGPIDLKSVNGGVTLTVPAGFKADLTARCTNGSVRVEGLELQAEGEQTRRRVSGRLNGGGPSVTLETTNGGVRVEGV